MKDIVNIIINNPEKKTITVVGIPPIEAVVVDWINGEHITDLSLDEKENRIGNVLVCCDYIQYKNNSVLRY